MQPTRCFVLFHMCARCEACPLLICWTCVANVDSDMFGHQKNIAFFLHSETGPIDRYFPTIRAADIHLRSVRNETMPRHAFERGAVGKSEGSGIQSDQYGKKEGL